MLGVFGIAAPQVATQPPQGWAAWVLLVAGAMAGAAIATGLIAAILIPPEEPRPPPRPDWSWLRRLLLPIAVLGLAVSVGVGTALGFGAIRSALRGCITPAEVPVVASPETFETATALARAFELATARAREGCPSVSLSVYAADSTDVQQALIDRWQVLNNGSPAPVDYLRDLGPRPQIWMPDSTVDVDRLSVKINRTGVVSPLGTPAIYSWSPLVLAVPQGLDTVRVPGDWRALLEAYTDTGFDVVGPDSNASVAGQLSLAATYPSGQNWDLADFKVARDIEKLLTSGREDAGYPLGDTAALLGQYQSSSCDATPRTGLILPEQFVQRPKFAGRQVRADLGCPGTSRRLTAIYPPDTLALNHPLVPLSWGAGDNGPAARAAAQFGRWLVTDAGHQAIEASGLRAGDRRSAEARNPARATPGLDPALVDVIDQALMHHAEVARPVELLLAIDTSGSMATRFDLGTAVLGSTAERLSDGDRLGLLSFGDASARLLVKPAPAGRSVTGGQATSGETTRDTVRGALTQLRAAGGTPLLRALDLGLSTLIAEPVAAVKQSAGTAAQPEPLRALVVVTDGRDTAGGPNPGATADRARQADIRVYVVATGSVDCSLPVLATVTSRSGGGCLVARDDPEASADALAAAIWGVSHD